jgi:hypothetical protein
MKNLSKEDLLKFYKTCFYRFYLRPHFFWKQIKRMRSFRQVMDVFMAFKVLVMEGLASDKAENLMAWINFDVEAVCDKSIEIPLIPRLTWEVRNLDSVGT